VPRSSSSTPMAGLIGKSRARTRGGRQDPSRNEAHGGPIARERVASWWRLLHGGFPPQAHKQCPPCRWKRPESARPVDSGSSHDSWRVRVMSRPGGVPASSFLLRRRTHICYR
jgi:hypothetical protein